MLPQRYTHRHPDAGQECSLDVIPQEIGCPSFRDSIAEFLRLGPVARTAMHELTVADRAMVGDIVTEVGFEAFPALQEVDPAVAEPGCRQNWARQAEIPIAWRVDRQVVVENRNASVLYQRYVN